MDELFRKMISRCEIIMVDMKNNTIAFKHKSFAEFFYARSLLKDGDLRIDEKIFEMYWMNTIF